MNIGRRGFLGLVGGAIAALATKPARLLFNVPGDTPIPIDPNSIVIGQWADYWPIPASLRTYKVRPLGQYQGWIHPRFAADLLNLRPALPRRKPGKNNWRSRQQALGAIARANAVTRDILV